MTMNTKEAIAKKEETLEALILQAESSPAIIAVRAQQAAETLAKRQEAAGKIEMFRNEETATVRDLEAVRAAKEEIYLAAKAAMQSASDEFQAAHMALSIERNRASGEIGRQEQILIESADPAIDAAILFFRDKLDWLRTPGRISRNAVGSEQNILTWKKTVKEESNAQAINDAMRYCQAAITTLEQMKLLPAVDAEKIAALKAGIPKIDIYTQYAGEKPMEKLNTDPLSMLPSDSEMKWSIGKLNEKFKELMGRPAPAKRAEAGTREAPAIPGPAPAPRREATLDMYHQEKRKNRAF
jgi:hypothetical protein